MLNMNIDDACTVNYSRLLEWLSFKVTSLHASYPPKLACFIARKKTLQNNLWKAITCAFTIWTAIIIERLIFWVANLAWNRRFLYCFVFDRSFYLIACSNGTGVQFKQNYQTLKENPPAGNEAFLFNCHNLSDSGQCTLYITCNQVNYVRVVIL